MIRPNTKQLSQAWLLLVFFNIFISLPGVVDHFKIKNSSKSLAQYKTCSELNKTSPSSSALVRHFWLLCVGSSSCSQYYTSALRLVEHLEISWLFVEKWKYSLILEKKTFFFKPLRAPPSIS